MRGVGNGKVATASVAVLNSDSVAAGTRASWKFQLGQYHGRITFRR